MTTKKYTLTLELRYEGFDKGEEHYYTPKATLGIYSTMDEAIMNGNLALNELMDVIDIKGEKFEKNYLFGHPKTLILKRIIGGGAYFLSINTLDFKDPLAMINEARDRVAKLKEERKKEEEE
jgi:hypothetical protein